MLIVFGLSFHALINSLFQAFLNISKSFFNVWISRNDWKNTYKTRSQNTSKICVVTLVTTVVFTCDSYDGKNILAASFWRFCTGKHWQTEFFFASSLLKDISFTINLYFLQSVKQLKFAACFFSNIRRAKNSFTKEPTWVFLLSFGRRLHPVCF